MNNENVAPAPAPNPNPEPASAPTPNPAPAQSVGPTPVAMPRNKKSKAPLIIGGVAAAALIGGGIFALMHLGGGSSDDDSIFDANAFFLYDSEKEMYALFNEDGKTLTDFNIKYHSDFIDGYALVQNNEDQFGVIRDNGKMSIKYGTYSYMSAANGLYITDTDEAFQSRLITGSNKKIIEYNSDVASVFKGYGSSDGFLSIKVDDTNYNVYNVKGKLLGTTTDEPRFDDYNGLTLIDYGAHIEGYNSKNLDLVFSADTGRDYDIDEVSDDLSMIVLEPTEYKEKYYAVYTDGKFSEDYGACDDVDMRGNYYDTDTPYIICEKDDSDNLLIKKDGTISDIKASKYTIHDADNYVALDNSKAYFYVNGESKNTLDNIRRVDVYYDNYIATSYVDKKLYVLDLSGNIQYTHTIPEDSSLYGYSLEGFDGNGHLIFTDGSIEENEDTFIISKSGERLTDAYRYIYYYSTGFYEGAIDYSHSAIISADTKKKTDAIYSDIDIDEDGKVILAEKSDDEDSYDILDKNLEVIGSVNGNASLYDKYIRVRGDEKIEYYTLKGEKFFETKSDY